MKIRNIAFFGVMASILGSVGGAYADTTTDAKIIASKNYVDTQITGLTGTVSSNTTPSDTAVTGISQTNGKITASTGQITSAAISDTETTNALRSAATGTALTEVSAITGMVETSVPATDSATDEKVPTSKAVRAAIEQATTGIGSGAESGNVLKGSTNSKLVNVGAVKSTAAYGTLDQSSKGTYTATDITSGATAKKTIFTANATVNTDADAYFPTVAAVESRIAATDADIATINNSAVMQSGITATKVSQYDGYATTLAGKVSETSVQDTYSSTSEDPISGKGVANALSGESSTNNALTETNGKIAKVDAVKAAVTYLGGATAGTTDALKKKSSIAADAEALVKRSGVADNMEAYIPTAAAVEARVKAAENTAASDKTDTYGITNGVVTGTTPVTAKGVQAAIRTGTDNKLAGDTTTYAPSEKAVKTELDLKLDKNTAITASGTTKQIVTYDANGLVTGGTAAGGLATKDAVGSSEITDYSIVNADISTTAAIDYTKMANTLNGVNTKSTAATCSESNPCMLTYLGSALGFRWTNMDTNGLSADN